MHSLGGKGMMGTNSLRSLEREAASLGRKKIGEAGAVSGRIGPEGPIGQFKSGYSFEVADVIIQMPLQVLIYRWITL